MTTVSGVHDGVAYKAGYTIYPNGTYQWWMTVSIDDVVSGRRDGNFLPSSGEEETVKKELELLLHAEIEKWKAIPRVSDEERFMLQGSASTLDRIMKTGVFEGQLDNPFFESCFVHSLVCLNDMLQRLRVLGLRITFSDDMPEDHDIDDVTELVRKTRNAACHLNDDRKMDVHTVAYLVVSPRSVGRIGNFELRNDKDDDFAIFHGSMRMYLKAHLIRAYREATARLRENGLIH